MNKEQSQLMLDIINCPNTPKDECYEILNVQNNKPRRQVPEPWNGDIDTSSFLIIGSNPALVDDEVFPSKDTTWSSWIYKYIDKAAPLWSDNDATEYFECRFGKVCLNGKPIVDIKNNRSLRYDNQYRNFQNPYWQTYNQYCKAIDPSFKDFDYVVTDLVHCKGGKKIGFNKALPICIGYMKKIIDMFVANKAKEHNILIFGAENELKNKLQPILDFSNSTKETVGSFTFTNKRHKKRHDICKSTLSINGVPVNIFYYFTAPSGSNRASSPVTLNGIEIKW